MKRLIKIEGIPSFAAKGYSLIARKCPFFKDFYNEVTEEVVARISLDVGFSDRVKFQTGTATNLPFGEGYFDFVISTASFHHWLKPIECLKEIYPVLKENGEAWIYDIRRDTTKEVNAQLKEKHGWFLSFFFLNIVRPHSSVRRGDVEEILSSSEIIFSKKIVEDNGVMLKLSLREIWGYFYS